MYTRKILIALSTAIVIGVLGAGSLAQANEPTDAEGGFKIGPLGQVMGAPTSTGANAYGFAPSAPSKQPVQKHTAKAPAGVRHLRP